MEFLRINTLIIKKILVAYGSSGLQIRPLEMKVLQDTSGKAEDYEEETKQ